MTVPTIPPRPSRSSQNAPSGSSNMEVPKIPPRPAKRSVDRSVSPNRDAFARSPLNDPAFLHNKQHQQKESHLSTELPPRPPSVTLPSLGQEGSEYASFEDLSKTLSKEEHVSPQQTRGVGDLPLHAPKASVPSSTAKSRIQTVTRTDSSQAVAAGIGKLAPDDRSPRAPDSGRSDSSAGTRTRPASVYKEEEEQGIPEIGVQVPMYPNAGDVQAPTPSPFEQNVSTGVGFFNKGLPTGRHHGRTKSGREIFHGPPGSYGLHGHGVIPKDEFEKQWYAKHPEDLRREQAGEYGPHIRVDRKDYHWVGDDLVKLVHSASSQGNGMGTSREAIGTPDEQIGYLATEEYAMRFASPKPASGRPASISGKSGHVDSPLRHETGPENEFERTQTHESESEPAVIHIDPPSHPASKIHGGGYDPPTEDLGPEGGNSEEAGGLITERGYGVPILASDEVKQHPDVQWRQPAVTPELERRASGEFTLNDPDGHPAYIAKVRTHSRSSSRNNNRARFASPTHHDDRSGTPLESTKEYEPLFPDEDEPEKSKPKSAVDKLKRPDHLARHHFPSQDVWEDTPSSLQLETTVETPQAPEEPNEEQGDADAGTVFEPPKAEEARKDREPKEEEKSFLPEHKRFTNKHLNKEYLDAGSRPGMQHRFPSHDIWEDAPEHGQLVTTVSTPQMDEDNDYAESSPIVEKEKPSLPQSKPTVPSRPQKETSPTEKKAAPVIPERPKPSVPARPSKPLTKSAEKVPTLESQGSEAAPQPKPKPQIPARPAGGKIAALQASFLNDLNSKLGLGPQAPKQKEPEAEKEEEATPKQPLQDARKGRAKGPQRRKPASSPGAAAAAGTSTTTEGAPKLGIKLDTSSITTIWTIEEDGSVDVPAARMAEKIQAALKAPEKEKGAEDDVAGETEPDSKSQESADTSSSGVVSGVLEKGQEIGSGLLGLAQKAMSPLSKTSSVEETKADAGAQDNAGADDEDDAKPKGDDDASETDGKQQPVVDDKVSEEDKREIVEHSQPDEPTAGQAKEDDTKQTQTPAPQETDTVPAALPPPTKPQALPTSAVPTAEPVDMGLMEEGKDMESRDVGL